MPKRQKKYTSREMVLKDIDAARRKIKRLRGTAAGHLELSEIYCSIGNQVKRKIELEEFERLCAKANRMESTRLKRLGATLAAFDTVPLGIEGLNQEQVVLERV